MSDYSKTTNFTAKDNLTTGDPLKVIKGSYFDTEFDNIATAIATKYDSDNLATQAQAEGLTLDSVLLTPHSLNDVLVDNAGILGELQALADPNADRIFFWDDGEAADSNVAFLTVGDGIEISAATLQLPATLAGNGLTLTSGVLAVVGGNGITANADDIALTDAAASTTNPVDISSGVVSLDVEALTTIEGNALAATDTFYVEDGGVSKGVEYQGMGLIVQTAQTTQTLAATDMNTIMEFDGTATLTLPLNATTALPIGASVLIVVDHATQEVTITAATSVTLNSIFHPGGTAAASDVVMSGGMAALTKIAADEWYLSGDIKDA